MAIILVLNLGGNQAPCSNFLSLGFCVGFAANCNACLSLISYAVHEQEPMYWLGGKSQQPPCLIFSINPFLQSYIPWKYMYVIAYGAHRFVIYSFWSIWSSSFSFSTYFVLLWCFECYLLTTYTCICSLSKKNVKLHLQFYVTRLTFVQCYGW